MDKDQAIHYAKILLTTLQAYQNRCGSGKIHAAKTETAILELSVRLAIKGQERTEDLIRCIERAEDFLADQWR